MSDKNEFTVCLDASGLSWKGASNPSRIMRSDSEPEVLVFARGYISNTEDCRRLVSRFHTIPPNSVSDWIALAYREYGELLPKFVTGQYCVCIVIPAAKEVFLIQDGLGLRSLFYSASATRLVVSTELKGVVEVLSTPSMDIKYFAGCLAQGGFFTSRTPYQGILRINHGKCLRWRNGQINTFTPWTPNYQYESIFDSDSLAERLRNEVNQAVTRSFSKSHSAKLSPITWCEFSAGLDSTTVLFSALNQGQDIEAFSWLSGSNCPGSDAPYIRQAAPLLPCGWRHIDTDRYMPYSVSPSPTDEPQGAIVAAKSEAYASLLNKNNVEVMLTGMGGDLTFGSVDITPFHLADGLFALNPFLLWGDLSSWIEQDPRGRGRMFWLRTCAFPAYAGGRHTFGAKNRYYPLPAWLRETTVRDYAPDLNEFEPPIPPSMPFGRAMLWREAYFQSSMVARNNNCTQASTRHPLLDRTLLAFTLGLPYQYRSSAGRDRILQRQAFASLLPQAIIERTIKGTAQAGLDQGLRDSVSWIKTLRQAKNLRDMDLVNSAAWNQAIDRATFGVYDSAPHFIVACELEAWLTFRSAVRPQKHTWMREPINE